MNARNRLTKQEKTVLKYLTQGWRTARIASELVISPRTVETHISHIFDKLGVTSRTEAVLYAIKAIQEIRINPEDARDDRSYPLRNQ
jgi:DNA-binding NarL/FixJ family response regulator